MNAIWPKEIQFNRVLDFVTDAAPYMVSASNSLQDLFSKMVF